MSVMVQHGNMFTGHTGTQCATAVWRSAISARYNRKAHIQWFYACVQSVQLEI